MTWRRTYPGLKLTAWTCNRDGFSINTPENPTNFDSFLTTLAQHSTGHVGAIVDLAQLDL